MRRLMSVGVLLLWVCLFASGSWPFAGTVAAQTDANAYFDGLVARVDHWKSNSLRSQALIDSVSAYAPNRWVTYDASADAAKTVIPAFGAATFRIASVGSDRITFDRPLTTGEKNLFIQYRAILVDDEILTVIRWYAFGTQFPDDSSVLVNRAQYGTTLLPHASGTPALLSGNSLMDYLNVPLGTQDGSRYLITWDAFYSSSYLGTDNNPMGVGHKEFQLTSGPRGGVWLETRTRNEGVDAMGKVSGFDRNKYVALIDGRYYGPVTVGSAGSNLTSVDSLAPQVGRFYIKPNQWTRFWWLIEQRANDYDLATLWIADQTTEPVKIFDQLTLQVQGSPALVNSWWLEQNSSYDLFRGSRRDLVSYVRNFVALVNPGDVPSLLIRPTGGVVVSGPTPPTNVRIVSRGQ